MKPAAIVLSICVAAMAPAVGACGYCVEDKVAAVYDHAIVAQARAQAHEVVYLSLEFTGPVDGATAARIVRAVERIASVDRGSVRVALDAGSVSLAFDAKRALPGAMVDAVERAVAPMGARAALLQFGGPAGT
jgi:hypothetical protein